MKKTLASVWTLLLGMGFVGMCIGMQNSLLGLRANIEGFSTLNTGMIMSGYFIGFLLGTVRAPIVITRVGHIRAFGAFASLASITILIHAVFISEWLWFFMRVASGFALSGIYVVAESWLNDRADNKTRGTILSIYVIVLFGGVGIGQLLLNLANPSSFELFMLVSILISFALIPMLATNMPIPVQSAPRKVTMTALYKKVPLGISCAFLMQCCYASIFSMTPVVLSRMGLDVSQIAAFMTVFIFGGLLVQIKVGKWSDKVDRRMVMAILAAASAIMAVILEHTISMSETARYLTVALFGACVLPIYSLGIAHSHDYLEADQRVGASSALIRAGGMGSILGPLLVSLAMQKYGDHAYFVAISLAPALVFVYATYRIARREKAKNQVQGDVATVAPTVTSEEMLVSAAEAATESTKDVKNT